MRSQRKKVTFRNQEGIELAGLMELTQGELKGVALFAHCFTCGKDINSASRIARALANRGIAVLRFDFTGLGSSDGDFGNTNFSSNVEDLISAADYLAAEYQTPAILIGHSLGGTAVLSAAAELSDVKAVVTIGSPAEPDHVAHQFGNSIQLIEEQGVAEVNLAGRKFTIKKHFLEDIREHSVLEKVKKLKCAKLFFHSPVDAIVNIEQAAKIYQAAHHPKSFVSLDNADHLLMKSADAEYVADTLSAWVKRYLPALNEATPEVANNHVLVAEKNQRFTRSVYSDDHAWFADEPVSVGGDNIGPDPYEHLLAALGTCTSMTMRMYANRKQWPVQDIYVSLQHARQHVKDCECDVEDNLSPEAMLDIIQRTIRIEGDQLTDEQKQRLLDIADKCPVHKTLTNTIVIKTVSE